MALLTHDRPDPAVVRRRRRQLEWWREMRSRGMTPELPRRRIAGYAYDYETDVETQLEELSLYELN